MSKISIIIPAYNAEEYIINCLESISKQTFTDFEVIVVDDGSKDNTANLCTEYTKCDPRFRLLKQANGGVSSARNLGLKKIKGEWVTFIDADDWIESNTLDILYSYISENIDIVMGGFFFSRGIKETISLCSPTLIHKKDFPSFPLALMVPDASKVDGIMVSVEQICAACGKLTRKELLEKHDICFDENLKLNEDGHFHLRCFLKARDVVIIDTPLYHYRITSSSANFRYRPDIHEENLKWAEAFGKIAKELPTEIQSDFLSLSTYRMYCNLMNLNIENANNHISTYSRCKQLGKLLKSSTYNVLPLSFSLPILKKIEYYLLEKKLSAFLLFVSWMKLSIKRF